MEIKWHQGMPIDILKDKGGLQEILRNKKVPTEKINSFFYEFWNMFSKFNKTIQSSINKMHLLDELPFL